MKPRKVITVPLAENSASTPEAGACADSPVGPAAMVTDAVEPVASAIWEATVRFQIRSYSLKSLPRRVEASEAGVRKVSPDGRIASCASCAFLLFPLYRRGLSGTVSGP